LEGSTILVPAIGTAEVANGFLMAERRKRLQHPETQQLVALLESLSVIVDSLSVSNFIHAVPPLAKGYRLAAYDAAYLELALRYRAPLASLDSGLKNAERKAGIAIYNPHK
jgi:predicted nucleic acid-binding protein